MVWVLKGTMTLLMLEVEGDVQLVPHLPLDTVKQLPPDLLPTQLTGSLQAGQLQGMVRLRVTPGSVHLAGLQEWCNN